MYLLLGVVYQNPLELTQSRNYIRAFKSKPLNPKPSRVAGIGLRGPAELRTRNGGGAASN